MLRHQGPCKAAQLSRSEHRLTAAYLQHCTHRSLTHCMLSLLLLMRLCCLNLDPAVSVKPQPRQGRLQTTPAHRNIVSLRAQIVLAAPWPPHSSPAWQPHTPPQ